MNNKMKKKRPIDKRIVFFIEVMGVGILFFWIMAIITDWKSTQTTLFRWDHWFFMDWFGELHRIQTGVYTGEDIANYPAFCFLIFKLFYAFLPKYEGHIYDDYNIRAMQQSVLPFTLFIIAMIFLFYHIFRYMMKKKRIFEKEGMAIVLLLSAPFLFLVERGNLIIIALPCTFLYVILYDSEEKWKRILSYVFLAIAAAIKVYPAIFGILTFMKKRYKETVLLVILGVGIFAMPFVFFGGVDACLAFIQALSGSSAAFCEYGFGYDFSIYNLERLVLSLCLGYQPKATNISIIIVLSCLVISFLCVAELWKRTCVLALFIILIPKFSYFYTTLFLLIPLLFMLREKTKKIHYVYIFEFLLIFFPWIHLPLDEVNFMCGEELSHVMGAGHIMIYMGILGLLITILVDGIYQKVELIRDRKKI